MAAPKQAADMNAQENVALPSKIIDNVYLGTVNHAWDGKVLKKLQITHIVCCISGASNYKLGKDMKRLMIPVCLLLYMLCFHDALDIHFSCAS